jgi:hypothetical protein
MHTFQGNSCHINYNADYSGSCYIASEDIEIQIDINDLFDFVAEAVRNSKMSVLEDAKTKDLLGL